MQSFCLKQTSPSTTASISRLTHKPGHGFGDSEQVPFRLERLQSLCGFHQQSPSQVFAVVINQKPHNMVLNICCDYTSNHPI